MDNRDGIYQELHGGLLENIEAENRHSAETILKMLFDIFQPNSVLDVGCGLGTWLSVAQKMNVSEIMGIDGSWLDKSRLRIDPDLVSIQDLEQPLEIGRKFDLVICLEVAEHLSSDAAPNFIDSLTNHGDIILFSAAIPFQGGSHHINERFPDYWYSLFRERDFEVIDFIRPQIWDDSSVLWWLRQNIMLFVKKDILAKNPIFAELHQKKSPLSIVHPEFYVTRFKSVFADSKAEQYQNLMAFLETEGLFSVTRQSNGQIMITKVTNNSESSS